MTAARAISPPSPKSEDTFLSGDCQLYFSTGSLADMLIYLQDWGEHIAQSPHALEYHVRRQVGRVQVTFLQFFPGEWCGDRRVSHARTQGVRRRDVAPDAVLCVVHRHTIFLMRRTVREGDQGGVARREPLPLRFDPGADALEGVDGRERHEDVQPPRSSWDMLGHLLVRGHHGAASRFPHGSEGRLLARIQVEDGQVGLREIRSMRATQVEFDGSLFGKPHEACRCVDQRQRDRVNNSLRLALYSPEPVGCLLWTVAQIVGGSLDSLRVHR